MKKFVKFILILIILLGVAYLYAQKNPDNSYVIKTVNFINKHGSGYIPAIKLGNSTQTIIDLTNCKSYFDGCNTCTVEAGRPSACTLMYCETPSEAKCLEIIQTGTIDLTNCKSYFDGCNTCFVTSGQIGGCTRMFCETPSEAKCLEYNSDNGSTTSSNTSIANPASVYCEKNGGKLEIKDSTGGQYGMCNFSDGTSCEERSYFRGECGTGIISNNSKSIIQNSTGDSIACTMEYAPVCAKVQIQCIKAPCDPIEETFSNKCQMNANKLATFLHDGECSTDKNIPAQTGIN